MPGIRRKLLWTRKGEPKELGGERKRRSLKLSRRRGERTESFAGKLKGSRKKKGRGNERKNGNRRIVQGIVTGTVIGIEIGTEIVVGEITTATGTGDTIMVQVEEIRYEKLEKFQSPTHPMKRIRRLAYPRAISTDLSKKP